MTVPSGLRMRARLETNCWYSATVESWAASSRKVASTSIRMRPSWTVSLSYLTLNDWTPAIRVPDGRIGWGTGVAAASWSALRALLPTRASGLSSCSRWNCQRCVSVSSPQIPSGSRPRSVNAGSLGRAAVPLWADFAHAVPGSPSQQPDQADGEQGPGDDQQHDPRPQPCRAVPPAAAGAAVPAGGGAPPQ